MTGAFEGEAQGNESSGRAHPARSRREERTFFGVSAAILARPVPVSEEAIRPVTVVVVCGAVPVETSESLDAGVDAVAGSCGYS